MSRLEKNIYPYIGAKPVVEITPADILRVIQLIEKRGAIETAHRALQNISQVMRATRLQPAASPSTQLLRLGERYFP